MSEKVVMSIDQGTTGSRVSLYKHDGTLYTNGWFYVEHSQTYPKPGWVEHDPLEIWLNVKRCIRNVLDKTRVKPGDIVAIGVANQRETVIAWNPKTGRPVSNAIVWQDRRTAKLVDHLRENYLNEIVEKTGLIPDSYFSSTKIWWMLENIQGLREKILKREAVFGTIDTWIIWNLTNGSQNVQTPEYNGAFVTDYSNASRTMLFNIHRLAWDENLAEIQGEIPVEALALPRPSSDKNVYGWTGPEVSSIFEGSSKPVTGDAGDQQAALLGQAGFEPYDAKCTYGTGNFILMNTGEHTVRSKTGLLATVLYSVEPGKAVYALEGSIFITGAAIQWLRDGLKIIEVSGEVNPLAEAAEETGGTYFIPAFTGLGAPYWDPYARGMVIGLTRGTSRRHIARAVLESIAYLTRDVVEAMCNDTGRRVETLKADGGASRSDFLLQFQADILDTTVVRPLVQETTSLGAAYLAGLAVGFWRSIGEVKNNWRMEKEFKPMISQDAREKLYKGWKAAVKRSLGWAREVPWAYGYEEAGEG